MPLCHCAIVRWCHCAHVVRLVVHIVAVVSLRNCVNAQLCQCAIVALRHCANVVRLVVYIVAVV